MKPFVLYFSLFTLIISFCASCLQAEVHSGKGAKAVEDKIDMQVLMFPLDEVKLLDGEFKTAMEHNAQWLLSLEPDRFLAWFRKEAGLEPKGQVYGGWEKETIAGHSLGHYMSALAMMYAETGEKEYKDRCDYIVSELAAVQQANGSGYMSAFPNGRKCFDEVQRGEIRSAGFDLNGIWVPWYTQHKLMAGLLDIYEYTGSQAALDVLKRHADWIITIVGGLTDQQWQNMLNCEHGGINEAFAQLYAITADQRYLEISRKFYHKAILDPLSIGQDSLSGHHSNTQIPKLIGCARLFELTGDTKFQSIANYAWDLIVNHYSYSNGGNSAEEYFGLPDVLGTKMHDTTETCNTYNMLKLTRHLYSWQPNVEYMDYYERALLNHILTHQHPNRGGALVYKGFLDMPARKGYSHPTESFWCCVGSGMENHAKYADTIYAHGQNSLYVNLFISSELNWKEKGIVLRQESSLPETGKTKLIFLNEKPIELQLKIRKPYWTDSIAIRSETIDNISFVLGQDGYYSVKHRFAKGDVLDIDFNLALRIEALPDMPDRVSFLYGPTLLATQLQRGQISPLLVADDIDSLLASFVQIEPLKFKLDGIAQLSTDTGFRPLDLSFVPLYKIADESYSVYLDKIDSKQWQEKQQQYAQELKKQAELAAVTTDFIALGRMQDERDHNLTSQGRSDIGSFNGKNWRDTSSGWFEFEMKVDPEATHKLICTYWGSDRGSRTFDLLIDGNKIATQNLNNNKPNSFFDVSYDIPKTLTNGKTKVKVRIQAHPNNYGGGLFEARIIRQKVDSRP